MFDNGIYSFHSLFPIYVTVYLQFLSSNGATGANTPDWPILGLVRLHNSSEKS